MNLDEIRRRLPMYVKKEYDEVYDSVYMGGITMGILTKDHRVYYKAICCHEDIEYARRIKFLSFFIYTKLLTIDGFCRETIYELHGFKNDCK